MLLFSVYAPKRRRWLLALDDRGIKDLEADKSKENLVWEDDKDKELVWEISRHVPFPTKIELEP